MGFGLLFFGYFFNLNQPYKGIDILPDIIGCILMYLALKKLNGNCPDNKGFKYAQITLLPYSVFALASFGIQLARVFSSVSDNLEQLFSALLVIYSIIIGIYHIFLLTGIHSLSKSVGLEKPAARASRMISLTAVYYLIQLLSYLGAFTFIANLAESPDIVMNYINFAVYVIGFMWFILTWALIFTCYMRICLEGDEDMPHEDDALDKIANRFKGKDKK